MKKYFTIFAAIIFASAILLPQISYSVERKYIMFDNLDYYADTCYAATLRYHDNYKDDLEIRPFNQQTFNEINVKDYDAAIFPIGNTGKGFRGELPASYGTRYSLSSTVGGVKIIDKIMEFVNSGTGVIIIAQNALSSAYTGGDPKVNNLLWNILGIDYQGQKYECGDVTESGNTTEWRWWMFKIEGSLEDPVGMGLPKYYNGGDESSGQAIDPLAFFLEVDWFRTKDSEKYPVTERTIEAESDTAMGIRTIYPVNEEDTSRICFYSMGWEGFGGRWKIKQNMMLQAMRWVVAEDFKPGPKITAVPNTLNFGGIALDSSRELEIELRHVGVDEMEIYYATLDEFTIEPWDSEAFSITEGGVEKGDDPVILQPGESHILKVKFEPDVGEKHYAQELIIEYNKDHSGEDDFPDLTLYIEGTGGEEKPEGGYFTTNYESNTISFGTVTNDGGSVDKTLTLKNEGQAAIFVRKYIPDEYNEETAFTFREQITNPTTLDFEESFDLTIRFFPQDPNTEYNAKLKLEVDKATNGNEFWLDLVGKSGPWTSVPSQAATDDGLLTVKVAPNPAEDNFNIEYIINGDRERNIEMFLVDVTGKSVAELKNGVFMPGTYHINRNTDNLSAGNYYLIAKMAEQSISVPVVIMK